MGQRILLIVVAVAAVIGFSFAAVSTSDFVAHLDRQVHGIHCSFFPGGAPDMSGSSGCHVTLMSPYSSVLRDRVWGGVPISLPAMAVFAYLAFFALALLITSRARDARALAFLVAATAVPLITSVVMGWIALRELDAACKLCIGIYVSSFSVFTCALIAWIRASRGLPAEASWTTREEREDIEPEDTSDATVQDDSSPYGVTGSADTALATPRRLATASEMDRRLGGQRKRPRSASARRDGEPIGWGALIAALMVGIAFVLVPVGAYAAGAPNFERYLGACGTLAQPSDTHHVLVSLGNQTRSVQVLEVLDPLCPACRGFERRFSDLPAADQTSRRALLFPLDSTCNWMVDRPIHAGACAISEAILCADENAEEVLEWAFEHQEEIRTATERDPDAAAILARQRFPALRACIGSPRVRARLNQALRWAVANQLPVLTPQVYVGDTRVCDADTDLGLDWTLARLLRRAGQHASLDERSPQ